MFRWLGWQVLLICWWLLAWFLVLVDGFLVLVWVFSSFRGSSTPQGIQDLLMFQLSRVARKLGLQKERHVVDELIQSAQ